MAKSKKTSTPRAVGNEDTTLGQRIRARRIEAAMSQAELGDRLGVSFQQVQKYEKGVNRVSAVRLAEIAKALGESLDYFTGVQTASTSSLMSLLTDNTSQRLLRAFAKLEDPGTRHKVVGLLESITA